MLRRPADCERSRSAAVAACRGCPTPSIPPGGEHHGCLASRPGAERTICACSVLHRTMSRNTAPYTSLTTLYNRHFEPVSHSEYTLCQQSERCCALGCATRHPCRRSNSRRSAPFGESQRIFRGLPDFGPTALRGLTGCACDGTHCHPHWPSYRLTGAEMEFATAAGVG